MSNIDKLIDTLQQNSKTNASHETARFSTLDMKYAYNQLKVDLEICRYCNFKNS